MLVHQQNLEYSERFPNFAASVFQTVRTFREFFKKNYITENLKRKKQRKLCVSIKNLHFHIIFSPRQYFFLKPSLKSFGFSSIDIPSKKIDERSKRPVNKASSNE